MTTQDLDSRLLCESNEDEPLDITIKPRTAKFNSWDEEPTTKFTGYVAGKAVTTYCDTHDLAGCQALVWAEHQGYSVPLDLWARWDPSVFIIPDMNLKSLQKRIGQMNRKAEQLDVPGIELDIIGSIVEQRALSDRDRVMGIKHTVHCQAIRVTGDRIRLDGGWIFIGTLEHDTAGNILRAVPDEDIPERYRLVDPVCDHCQLDRKRKDTYIVRGYGKEYMQVGRTCLKDFLGHRSPHLVAAYMTALAELGKALADDDYWGSDVGPTGYEAIRFLTFVAGSMRLWGWTPRSKAGDYNMATADTALLWIEKAAKARLDNNGWPGDDGLVDYTPDNKPIETNEADHELAQLALDWSATLSTDETAGSDYLWNVFVVAQNEAFTFRQMGIAASMIQAYQRATATGLESANKSVSGHVGTIKQRTIWSDLLLVDIKSWDTQYGVNHLHKFQDPDGNCLVWKTGTVYLNQGSTYTGKATVKAHDTYNGENQTVLTRAAFDIQEAS